MTERVPIGAAFSLPSEASRNSMPTALMMDLHPVQDGDNVWIDLGLVTNAIAFCRSDGSPTGYTFGCREANFIFSLKGSTLWIEADQNPPLEFERTLSVEREKGVETNRSLS
jgi:hypothetical protein